MNIYVTRDGQTYGPYPAEQAHVMIQQGQLFAGDLACPEGSQQWVPLAQVLGLPPAPAPALAAPAAPAVVPQAAAPLVRRPAMPAVPVAQPATALPVPGAEAPQTVPIAAGGVAPGSASAQFALQQAYKKAASAFTQTGLAAALSVIGLGLPLTALAAGGGGFFGATLGVMWASIIGLPTAGLCLWWFFVAKGKAATAKSQFEAMRVGY